MKKIKFYPINEISKHTIKEPVPASTMLPDWYKSKNKNIVNNKAYKYGTGNDKDIFNLTIKKCIPFFDAISEGYIATLSSDIYVTNDDNFRYKIMWEVPYDVVSEHSVEQIGYNNLPKNFDKVFKWNFNFIIKTPPGYSCLFTHPRGYFNLPFKTIDGIVDTDTHPVEVNFPFFLEKNFSGKIEKGTPICQIIPFKREPWKSYRMGIDENYSFKKIDFLSFIENSYRNRFWNRKSFK